MTLIPDQPVNCPSCGKKFEGPYCYACGEKQTSPKDYTLKKYSAQAIDMFTHFDGKFFTTFKYLLFYPGKLTTENLNGRKVKLMKPVQLFLVISLVYFFAMKSVDVFVTFLRHAPGSSVYQAAKRKAAEKNIPFEAYAEQYDSTIANLSKTFIFVLVPMIAFGAWLLFYRKSKHVVPHLLFATHFLAFFIAFTLIYFEVFLNPWLDPKLLSRGQKFAGVAIEGVVVLTYLFLSLKRIYQQGWLITSTKTLVLITWIILMLTVYREGIAWLNLYLA